MATFSELLRTADLSPLAQRARRNRLQPQAIVDHLTYWRGRTDDGEHYAAIDLIKLTRYLQCSPGERIQLIDQVLDILDTLDEIPTK